MSSSRPNKTVANQSGVTRANAEALAARFPEKFLFGAATASYQIEGSVHADGRGRSIWDTFSETPGKVVGGDTGAMACDHFNRLDADLDLMADLGLAAYRFSIAWPRVIPQGFGRVNAAGLDFYDRIVDGCLARGIKPFATLYHWDLPQALEDKGGWRSKDTPRAFADYAEAVMLKLGDRLAAVSTLNEPWCSAYLGHLKGIHAPGLKDPNAAMHAVHYLNLAHGLGCQAVRAVRSDMPVGVVLNTHSIYPGTDAQKDMDAAKRAFQFNVGAFMDPIFKGHYPAELIEEIGNQLPADYEGDLPDICQKNDYLGINFYMPDFVFDAPNEPWPRARHGHRGGLPKTDIGWEILPDAFTHLFETLKAEYDLPPIYITENGCCDNTNVKNDKIEDTMRRAYLENHIDQVAGMIENGVDIRGYFAWSLMDNFEWAEGYTMRFGIVHVDYKTQRRTIKQSGSWYQALCSTHKSS